MSRSPSSVYDFEQAAQAGPRGKVIYSGVAAIIHRNNSCCCSTSTDLTSRQQLQSWQGESLITTAISKTVRPRRRSSIRIRAGARARAHIFENGLQPDHFEALLGASGGPKWFILKGLDRYLYGTWFRHRQLPLYTLGSSAGAWQLACLPQADPAGAIDRLADYYSQETYSAKPGIGEITEKARRMVQHLLGPAGAAEIAEHPLIHTHILANRCRGLLASDHHGVQLSGLLAAATANALSRRALGFFFERLVLHQQTESRFQFSDLPTRYTRLRADNVADALMATGAIPLVLEGVRQLPGAPSGVYRDGGIMDYHFDLPLLGASDGLVLYPHFSPTVTPGWFDKHLRYRRASLANYDNVVMICPSTDLIAALPDGRISDRNDFLRFDANTRQQRWRSVLQESERMAEDFAIACEELAHGASADPEQLVEPFDNQR